MNIREIILEKIKTVGANGLVNGAAECGCGGDYLFHCGHVDFDCELATNLKCKNRYSNCEHCGGEGVRCEDYYVPFERKGETKKLKRCLYCGARRELFYGDSGRWSVVCHGNMLHNSVVHHDPDELIEALDAEWCIGDGCTCTRCWTPGNCNDCEKETAEHHASVPTAE